MHAFEFTLVVCGNLEAVLAGKIVAVGTLPWVGVQVGWAFTDLGVINATLKGLFSC